jgi:ribonuclease HI
VTLIAFTDGASRGNPGESGIGVILRNPEGTTVEEMSGYLGTSTNNRAEYAGLLACVRLASRHNCTHLISHSDSELIVKQMLGTYKIKDKSLKYLAGLVHTAARSAGIKLELRHIPREENAEADRLANVGIDSREPVPDRSLLPESLFESM